MSLDLAIRGGTVIDGTGAPGQPADVGIAGGRIAEISPRLSDTAVRTIDAQGLVVAPGFVDIHTHLDAAVLWDDTLSPSPLHGVTTVIGGNCGFTVAPITPEARDYLLAMLARVEGMPAESLATGLNWDWGTTAEYLDRTDRPLAANAGFLVGHSAIRRTVMGERSSEAATAADVEAMAGQLRAGLTAGGLGFSTSTSNTHHDGDGRPVPSRAASRDEIIALCRAVQGTAAPVVEISPGVEGFDPELAELMADMSLAADRPLNWNPVIVDAATEAGGWDRLRMSDAAAERGAEVLALTIPLAITARHCLATPSVLAALPGWEDPMALPHHERRELLADPVRRQELDRSARSVKMRLSHLADWGAYVIGEGFSLQTKPLEGRTVGDVASERGVSPWDALCDIAVDDDLRTVLVSSANGADRADWEARARFWTDDRVVMGASDAGAHLDQLDFFTYTTGSLAASRQFGLLSLEEHVRQLTDVPARLYGLAGRGRIAEGWHADLVVFDPDTVAPGPVHTRYDLPADAGRLYGEAVGVASVIVNGAEVVTNGQFTDARPGHLLRSGRDTEPVTLTTRRSTHNSQRGAL
ncbi:N-acyl-D-amino-acid deacylase family protein [Candidatus Poriferisocius sp.]|uniref:N-acyl-D-amino-acid deacylase family protein n=1 Tax=Candidatus Poriferisocius sp. TaxID=3101276 RepID=UPI003B02A1CD